LLWDEQFLLSLVNCLQVSSVQYPHKDKKGNKITREAIWEFHILRCFFMGRVSCRKVCSEDTILSLKTMDLENTETLPEKAFSKHGLNLVKVFVAFNFRRYISSA